MAEDSRKQCYCIFCGYKYDVNSSTQTLPIDTKIVDEKISVIVVAPSLPYLFSVEIDGKKVCAISGGSEKILVEPGRHHIHVKANSLIGGEVTGVLKEGSRITISPGFLGLKINIM